MRPRILALANGMGMRILRAAQDPQVSAVCGYPDTTEYCASGLGPSALGRRTAHARHGGTAAARIRQTLLALDENMIIIIMPAAHLSLY